MSNDDPYFVLGVARTCSGEELKLAYRKLARENHPDMARDKGAATIRMTRINAAWALVGDPQKRSAFDARWRLDELDRARRAEPIRAASVPKPPAPPPSTPTKTAPPPRPPKAEAPPPAPPQTKSKAAPRRPASVSTGAARHARLAEASRLLFKQNKPNEALDVCKSILKSDFRNIPARELMGEAYLRLGQTDRALAVWEQALVLAPANITLRRRWLSLMTPETRAVYEQRVALPKSAPVATNLPRPKTSPSLLSRLVGKLKRR